MGHTVAIRSHAIVIAFAAGLNACSTLNLGAASNPVAQPGAAANSASTAPVDRSQLAEANTAMATGKYVQAENLYLALSAQQQELALQQQALTGLTMLYLKPDNPRFNVNAAIEMMDQLNAILGHGDTQRLHFNSLQLLLENTVLLTQLQQASSKQRNKINVLQDRVQGLETALERLRRITLQ